MNYFVTAIGTDCGKTVVSAMMAEALGADYWKPIQAGLPRDSDTVRELVSKSIQVFPESFLLHTAASPHAAAKIDGVEITLDELRPPSTSKDLIIEGAGGAMVPINDEELIIDIAAKIRAEIILVSNLYLGSINHTLLTAELLKQRNYSVKGIIFNEFGGTDLEKESIDVIMKHCEFTYLYTIDREEEVDSAMVQKHGRLLAEGMMT